MRRRKKSPGGGAEIQILAVLLRHSPIREAPFLLTKSDSRFILFLYAILIFMELIAL